MAAKSQPVDSRYAGLMTAFTQLCAQADAAGAVKEALAAATRVRGPWPNRAIRRAEPAADREAIELPIWRKVLES